MKKIFYLLLIFSNALFSQQFQKLDSLQFKQAIDQLVQDTGRKYQLVTDRKDDERDNLKFVNVNDSNDILLIEYGSGLVGENKDLEIKGVKKWGIYNIYGKYLAVFPIWKRYVDPKADPETLSKKGFMTSKNYSITRYNDNGYWRLSL